MTWRTSGLGRSFRAFLAGQTTSGVGTMVTTVALPLVAVQQLHASTFDVGLLEAVEWFPALLIGLPVGALLDRHQDRCRAIMMVANLGQAAAIAAVPATAALGLLTLPVLLAAAIATGLAAVFFRTGYAPFLRQLLPEQDLATGNSLLRTGQSAARVSGPPLGGALSGAIGAANALLADAASFIVSIAALAVTTTTQPAPPAPPRRPILADIGEGLRYLRSSRLLSTLAIAPASANLFLTAMGSVEIVFLVRAVHVPAGAIGTLIATGGVGGIAGALATSRLTRRFSTRHIARSALAVTAPAALLIPATQHGVGIALFAIASPIVSFGISTASVTLLTLRLETCSPVLQARVSAIGGMLTSASIPTGALIGGTLGQLTSTRWALTLIAASYIAFGLALLHSPLKQPATTPDKPSPTAAPHARPASHDRPTES